MLRFQRVGTKSYVMDINHIVWSKITKISYENPFNTLTYIRCRCRYARIENTTAGMSLLFQVHAIFSFSFSLQFNRRHWIRFSHQDNIQQRKRAKPSISHWITKKTLKFKKKTLTTSLSIYISIFFLHLYKFSHLFTELNKKAK